jgi:hypothetical protein
MSSLLYKINATVRYLKPGIGKKMCHVQRKEIIEEEWSTRDIPFSTWLDL